MSAASNRVVEFRPRERAVSHGLPASHRHDKALAAGIAFCLVILAAFFTALGFFAGVAMGVCS